MLDLAVGAQRAQAAHELHFAAGQQRPHRPDVGQLATAGSQIRRLCRFHQRPNRQAKATQM